MNFTKRKALYRVEKFQTFLFVMNNDINEIEIGKRIRKLREAKGISVRKLAAKVGLSPGYISLLERGKTRFYIETLLKISKALQVSTFIFFLDDKLFEELIKTDITYNSLPDIILDFFIKKLEEENSKIEKSIEKMKKLKEIA